MKLGTLPQPIPCWPGNPGRNVNRTLKRESEWILSGLLSAGLILMDILNFYRVKWINAINASALELRILTGKVARKKQFKTSPLAGTCRSLRDRTSNRIEGADQSSWGFPSRCPSTVVPKTFRRIHLRMTMHQKRLVAIVIVNAVLAYIISLWPYPFTVSQMPLLLRQLNN